MQRARGCHIVAVGSAAVAGLHGELYVNRGNGCRGRQRQRRRSCRTFDWAIILFAEKLAVTPLGKPEITENEIVLLLPL